MHSEKLRGDDFEIKKSGVRVNHNELFSDFDVRDRVALLTNDLCEGIGAANLVLAYVTAFYDRYRAQANKFNAYPEFFTILSSADCANYSMLDIWPEYKHIKNLDNSNSRLKAICDKAVNILIVPERPPHTIDYDSHVLDRVRNNIERCYVYSFDGKPRGATLSIGCSRAIIGGWIEDVFDTSMDKGSQAAKEKRTEWNHILGNDSNIYQSYREIEFDEVLELV